MSDQTEAMDLARRYAKRKFRGLPNYHEMIADAVSYAWEWGVSGKGAPHSVAHYAVLRAGSRRKSQSTVRSIDTYGGRGQKPKREELFPERRTTRFPDPAVAAQMRIDFRAWMESLTKRQQAVATILAIGHSTSEAAVLLQVTPARVSQLRSELKASWFGFIADRE